ncbi:aldehyde dehydrogenase, putative [Talaromyces stipitatus ATCC 10500]|uniref:Aldehyde dehydrogenase, putative n=1 Tax=Talaromyces stipitatus (strain ATCC 10500 / CBS 375.48 / QM 6759 / NRRL 1006) TaxID=441959 RepID=B8MKK4_TALSN|nr:aldehyde dehydrogenase, putative [Talaromyces stipitatus ATCC 10500]EED15359.1 aldehyde dehydrogenase, putative [Talaromyces stipitatus ATCC 10500]
MVLIQENLRIAEITLLLLYDVRRYVHFEVYNSKPPSFFIIFIKSSNHDYHVYQTTGTAPLHVPLIIDSREEPGQKSFKVVSPYTNKVCWTVASATPADAVRAVETVQKAFPAWSNTKPIFRRDILFKAADILESRLEENGEFMRTEMESDVPSSTGLSFRWQFACCVILLLGLLLSVVAFQLLKQKGRARSYIENPWERSWGFLLGCFNLISTRAEDAAAVVPSMIEHPAIRKVNFTGSTAVGRKVASFCGQHLKPCLMELGGKNSAIVCEDANMEIAAWVVLMGAFLNSGQTCMATDRIISHSAIADNFKSTVKRLLTENSFAQLWALVSMASKARATEIITSALSAGAEVVHGVFHDTAISQPDSDVSKVSMAPVILGNGVSSYLTLNGFDQALAFLQQLAQNQAVCLMNVCVLRETVKIISPLGNLLVDHAVVKVYGLWTRHPNSQVSEVQRSSG